MNRMIKIVCCTAASLGLLLSLQTASVQAGALVMEIFYLPHRPAVAVVDKVEEVASEFENVNVRKYDFEDPGTKKMLKKYGIAGHMPVAIFIDGQDSFTVGGRNVKLRNFPKGNAFVPTFAGEWEYDDLRSILTEMAGKAK